MVPFVLQHDKDENDFLLVTLRNEGSLETACSMPGISGIELLKRFAPAHLPAIIFTTAFDQHALTAFDHNAVDYLLKPFNEARFKKAFDKAVEYIQLREIKKQQQFLTSISIKKGNKTLLLPVDEIEFFRATDDYISDITATQNYLITTTLQELENQLNPGCLFVFINLQ